MLPEDQKTELMAIFDEFEAAETAEARFARAMDNLQPLILNNSNEGGDWMAHGIHANQIYARQGMTRSGSEKLYEVTDQIIKKHIAEGHIKKDE